MTELLIKVDELKQILDFAQEMPTKYGMPLIKFIDTIAQKRLQDDALAKANAPVCSPVVEE